MTPAYLVRAGLPTALLILWLLECYNILERGLLECFILNTFWCEVCHAPVAASEGAGVSQLQGHDGTQAVPSLTVP